MTSTGNTRYLFDNAAPDAAEQVGRLLPTILDRHTQDVLNDLRISTDWVGLDLGAGAGTVAHFLAHEYGLHHVVAVDANPQHIVADGRIEVRQGNVCDLDLSGSWYGLIHARLLFMHLPEREKVLERVAAALRPGGLLVVSDWDCTRTDDMLLTASPELRAAFDAFQSALIRVGQAVGMDIGWARRVPTVMLAAGLTDVETVAHNQFWTGGQAGMLLHASNSCQLEEQLLDAGLTGRQLRILRDGMTDPTVNGYSYLMYTTVGRRPL